MATIAISQQPLSGLQPRRKRQPRKLNYVKCEFCRRAKVKVRNTLR